MKLGLEKTIIKSKLLLRLGIGIGIRSSIIHVTVRKTPFYIIKFFGDLADQRGGVVVREGC